MFRKIFIIISILSFILLTFGVWAYIKLEETIDIPEAVDIVIPEGTGIANSIVILEKRALLEPGWLFSAVARYIAYTENKKIYAGSYQFKPGMSRLEVLKAIMSGKHLNTVMITFPEGITLKKFAEIASTKLGIDVSAFLELSSNRTFLAKYEIDAPTAEGYLMPDTYEFFRGSKPEIILDKLLKEQKRIWDKHFAEIALNQGVTKHEVLTLASIIEAETPVQSERATVSGVYHNRLKKGMLLQADPTIQYAIGEQRLLKYRDLNIQSRYNTYKYSGLPPGPINSPSFSAIEAALNPERHNYLYFVAVGDGSGRHNFSENDAGHQRNRTIYKRNLKLNKTKTPNS